MPSLVGSEMCIRDRDNVEPRRDFIEEHAKYVKNLDI